jgi:PIN domain nuclease of toxin-antitoxin system
MGRVRQVSQPTYLLDTHVLLWALNGDPRLSRHHFDIIEAKENLTISVVSLWEIAIKRSLGKLTMEEDLLGNIHRRPIRILPVNEAHAMGTAALPLHHRDPFDRMLISQALVEGLTILTSDRRFADYDAMLA